MHSSLSKILNLTDLDKYHCSIFGYTTHHTMMYIRLFTFPQDMSPPLYLEFQSVMYFQGPAGWHGADFHIGTKEETVALIKSGIISLPDDALDYFVESHRLFLIEKPNYTVRILAATEVHVINSPLFSIISSTPPIGNLTE